MDFHSGNGGKGIKLRSDINITPLVDVVLVVLIIFMVMSQAMLEKLEVALPRNVESISTYGQENQTVVSIAKDGAIALNREPVLRDALHAKVQALMQKSRDGVVFFEIDDRIIYGDVVSIIDTCRGAGARVLGISTIKTCSSNAICD